jgi:hypothetical protein
MSDVFTFIPTRASLLGRPFGPRKVADVVRPPEDGPWFGRFNAALAVKITQGVGSMWCRYPFVVVALVSLPAGIRSGSATIRVSRISQTFQRLVPLSVIVGQNVRAAAADKRSGATFQDADGVRGTALAIQRHLETQDGDTKKIVTPVNRLERR